MASYFKYATPAVGPSCPSSHDVSDTLCAFSRCISRHLCFRLSETPCRTTASAASITKPMLPLAPPSARPSRVMPASAPQPLRIVPLKLPLSRIRGSLPACVFFLSRLSLKRQSPSNPAHRGCTNGALSVAVSCSVSVAVGVPAGIRHPVESVCSLRAREHRHSDVHSTVFCRFCCAPSHSLEAVHRVSKRGLRPGCFKGHSQLETKVSVRMTSDHSTEPDLTAASYYKTVRLRRSRSNCRHRLNSKTCPRCRCSTRNISLGATCP